MEKQGLRSIITPEIQEYIYKISEGAIDTNIVQFVNSLDPNIIDTLEKMTRNLADRTRKELASTFQIPLPPELESSIYLMIRRATITSSIIGWLLEHLARNNIEFIKAPSLEKYISSIEKADGDLEKLKTITHKKSTEKLKENQQIGETFQSFISTLSNL